MTIHKLVSKKNLDKRNHIQFTCFNCESIADAQKRLATRRGWPVSDYFVTDLEWRRTYSPAAQKANSGGKLVCINGQETYVPAGVEFTVSN